MRWALSWRADPAGRAIADRHYSRRTVGARDFVPPGRCLVLRARGALWVTSWPEYSTHAWPGAWVNTLFRREPECAHRASDLIVDALAATRWRFPDAPAHGMITFVDAQRVAGERRRGVGRVVGACFLRAGFVLVGETEGGHGRNPLLVFQVAPAAMPAPLAPIGAQLPLEAA